MALWKPFRGNRAGLDSVEKHDGYVYFCVDDGSLFFDYTDADGNLQRKQINAKDAETLMGVSLDELKKSISWNDLTDKPFEEIPPAFDIQWDGVIGDKFALDLSPMGFPNMYAVKVSDSVFTAEELDGALLTFSNDSWSDVIINSDTIDTSTYAGALNLDWVFIVYDADSFNTALGTPEGYITNGTYFICVIDENYINRFVAPTTIKKLDNKYLDLEGFAKSGSWNDLTDKPFGEMPPAFDITWDGNIDGHENFLLEENVYFVKVSDEVFTKEQLSNSTEYDSDGYVNTILEENIIVEDETGFIDLGTIFVIFSAETFISAMGLPEGAVSNGVWFVNYTGEEPYYTNRFVASSTIKMLDNKYLDLEGFVKTEDLEGYAKTEDLPAVAISGSWNDLTDRPFGTSETSWVLVASGPSDKQSVEITFTAVEGKNYKLEVVDSVMYTVLASTIAPCLTAPMMGMKYYSIGTSSDAVYGNGGLANTTWNFYSNVTSTYGFYKINIYEEHEAITTLDEKYLPDTVVLESELSAAIAEVTSYTDNAISKASDKISTISLPASGWTEATNVYSQVVAVTGATANSKVDIYPTPEQLIELQSAGIALVAVNEDGVVTVYALNNKPTSDYSIQVTLTELSGVV